jgi:hypothetical protein
MNIPIGHYWRWKRRKYPFWPFAHGPLAPIYHPVLALTPREAAMHWWVSGLTGFGKSTFLQNLAAGFHRAGINFTLLDPHGDLGPEVLEILATQGFFARKDAYDKLLYLDLPGAARQQRYLPFNILKQSHMSDTAIAGNIVETMHSAWPELDAASAMFDTLMKMGIRTLLANQLPINSLYYVLIDADYREQLLRQVRDPMVLAFWRRQWGALKPNEQMQQGGAAMRRILLLTDDHVLKYSLGQDEQAIDFRTILDEGKSMIVRLNLDGAGVQELLGALLTSMAVRGAKSRGQIEAGQRQGTHMLMLDEFPLFTTKSSRDFSRMLSETRKFGLFVVLAHQEWGQIEDLRHALQNCGMAIVFRMGDLDAPLAARMLERVETRSESVAVDESTRETEGMAEQWQHVANELMDMYIGEAYLRRDIRQRPMGIRAHFGPQHSYLLKVKTPPPARRSFDTSEIQRRYLERYFSHIETIRPLVEGRGPDMRGGLASLPPPRIRPA